MGEIADMILEGTLCEVCGGLVEGDASGYPRKCSDCTSGRSLMGEIAQGIGDKLGEDKGFVVVVFSFGEDTEVNYISNTRREDAIHLLREQIAYLEEKDDDDDTFTPLKGN